MTTDLLSEFARRLRALRLESGMEPKEFSQWLGVSKSRYQNWERGSNYPQTPEIIRISERCSVTCDWLLSGDYTGLPLKRAIALQALEQGILVPDVQVEPEAE